jgi:hypothetical protein
VGRCFVIQPFDKGAYDKRYEDVIVPAIKNAGLEDYRVDRDPGTKVLIESIEEGIKASDACIAEITTDNPNVWYELGFAIANGKPLVMISNSRERTSQFPFDVSHRPIVKYTPESPRDFQKLQSEITTRLKALLEAKVEVQTMAAMQSSETIGGISPHEIAALRIIMENQLSADDTVSAANVQAEMVIAGFTKLAATLSLRRLEAQEFIESVRCEDYDNVYWVYRVTPIGVEWLLSNQERFELVAGRQPQQLPPGRQQGSPSSRTLSKVEISDDDAPF